MRLAIPIVIALIENILHGPAGPVNPGAAVDQHRLWQRLVALINALQRLFEFCIAGRIIRRVGDGNVRHLQALLLVRSQQAVWQARVIG